MIPMKISRGTKTLAKLIYILLILVLGACAVIHEAIVSEPSITGWNNNGAFLTDGHWLLSFDAKNLSTQSKREVTMGISREHKEKYGVKKLGLFSIEMQISKNLGTNLVLGKPELNLKANRFGAASAYIGKINKFGECTTKENEYNFIKSILISEYVTLKPNSVVCIVINFHVAPPDPKEVFSILIPYEEGGKVNLSFDVTFSPQKETYVYR
jgi:hypothetical protein|tara:strand:- start:77 stop:712 length:636 start_codon:yes stop_codon:yes gene_type:complete